MSDKHLHIVSFDIPYPPNYGGVIDVFYKLKALHKKEIKITLHSFEYPGRDRSEELNKYCDQVYYYPRLLGLRSALSFKPYIVSSRRSNELLKNLSVDNDPILFEGLHSCYYINHPALKSRFKIYRESNIEHRYYFNLFKVERNLGKKGYFLVASCKLRMYQQILKHANLMLVVSEEDTRYLKNKFNHSEIKYLPSFHANDELECMPGRGDFALYNGNIEVPENAHAVEFLIKEVFAGCKHKLVVAGMNPPEHIIQLAGQHLNVKVIANPDDAEMFRLIREAHVNILVTFQATGLKLKLLNTLYKGRFCLVNEDMLNGTGLDSLCFVGNQPSGLKARLNELFQMKFQPDELEKRKAILDKRYSNQVNANKLIDWVFK